MTAVLLGELATGWPVAARFTGVAACGCGGPAHAQTSVRNARTTATVLLATISLVSLAASIMAAFWPLPPHDGRQHSHITRQLRGRVCELAASARMLDLAGGP